ncbi:hypothetical protein BJ123_11172 [Rhodopseudomonas thermotolerans]|jgi:hypothetical protein|uniref:Uncharacterized protein n=2 Tax=Rhodopseudomonas TaxID=1073 RepID=A0A336JZ60_9BRAD|nr:MULTISPECIES: hypothetical protein [Rhodopseudomonas]RED33235.1 hypothetical protein BJ125_11172 [Rhodopseudomonas pentothenatexigens]REF93984.1 hypothetical protein BJ123_11172 [Rhodopseudomonas thermotolerans]SSW91311.1 hypothetical protein SAMN05892882_11172 [Rhodopseudomonas pentothenatexigens]
MLFFTVSLWASASFWLMGIGYTDAMTWTIALVIGLVCFVLLLQRWMREWRSLRSAQGRHW